MFRTQSKVTRHMKKTKHCGQEPTEITDNRNRHRDILDSNRYYTDLKQPCLLCSEDKI